MAPAHFHHHHFDCLAEAPGGISKLRALILQLGVQGKLTQQIREDTPATEIISHFRKPKHPFAPIKSEELPFQIPATWVWSRLGACMELFNGRAFKPTDWSTHGLPIIRIKNLNNESAPFNHCATSVDDRHLVKDDDFLISWSGTPGTSFGAFIWKRGKAVLNQHIFRAELSSPELYKPYLRLAVNSRLDELIEKAHGGVGLQHVTKPTLERLPLPIPPLAEQRRIVAKVEELMGLCDALEVAQQARETVRTCLRTSALHKLAESNSDSKSAAFVLQNLSRLTTAPEDLVEIRHSVLQLAVRGQLVRQIQTDESALTLLTRLKLAKADGKKKRSDSLDADQVQDREGPFDIPANWIWARFPEVGEFGRGKSKHRPRNDPSLYTNGKFPLVQTGDVARSGGRITTFAKRYNETGLAQSKLWPRGTLCITIAANIADSGLLEFEACFPDSVVGFIPATAPEDARYFDCFIRTAKAHLLEFAPATAQKNINLEILTAVLIPLPPLAEQRRIVAKVDELMAVLDALEATLTTARTTSEKLLAATIARLHEPKSEPAEVIDFHSSTEFIRASLAAEIADRLRDDTHFGQTKLQKIFYLTEYLFELPEIDSRHVRFARGPHDPKLIEQVERKMKECEWFEAVPRDNGKGKEYLPLTHAGQHRASFEKQWPKKTAAIRSLIDKMKNWSTERCERFATAYAAWNDLILWKKPVTDAAIIDEILQHWHPEKLNIPKANWLDTLHWMQREGYTPKVFGRATKEAPQAELF